MRPKDASVKCFFFSAVPVAAAWGCSAVPVDSDPKDTESEPVEDGGTDTETDTGVELPDASLVQPTEDLLSDWELIWANAVGGTGSEVVHDIVASGPETFVAACSTVDSEDQFETLSFNGIAVPVGPENMFLVKYDIEGKVLWAKWAGGGPYLSGYSVDALEEGRIATAGWCGSNARFGPGEPNETWVLTGIDAPYDTSYFAVYEPDGTLAWVRSLLLVDQMFPQSRSECLAVDILDDGSVLAAGQFDGTVVAGAGTPTEATLVRDPAGENYSYNAYIVKYDPDGNLLWARREGGPGKTVASGLVAMADGSFFLAGGFRGTSIFGAGQAGETTLTPMGTESVFLARFDHEGNLVWVNDLGVDGNLASWIKTGKLQLLANGDVAVPGPYVGSMLAGDGEEVSFVAAETWGLFLSRYTAAGSRVWTRVAPSDGAGGQNMGMLRSVAELHDGSLVVTGGFNGSMIFAAGEPNETVVQGTGSPPWDALMAAYSESGGFLWALPQGWAGWDFFSSIVRHPAETPESDILIVGGGFSYTVPFGTGGDDVVTLTAVESMAQYPYDIVLLRFDREAE
jgi:hypothetical protein